MLNPRSDRAVQIVMKILALIAIALPLLSMSPAGATEKAALPNSKHNSVAKKKHAQLSQATRLKRAKSHPHKTSRKIDPARRTSAQFAPATLTLAKKIDSTTPAASVRPAPTSRPVGPSASRPFPEETDPPLQIGKTLYQRNGEIRQLEGQ